MSKATINKWVTAAISWITALIVGVWMVDSALATKRHVVRTWAKPEAVAYDGGSYNLSVVAEPLSKLNLFAQPEYFIYVGRDAGEPVYGHYLKFTFYPALGGTVDYDAHIRQSVVEWLADGVWFKPPSGHQLFVPKKAFTGGR